jgi:hypothetical protein
MSAGNAADTVGHGDNCKAEGEGDAELADDAETCEHRRAAAHQHQRERADEFGRQLLGHARPPQRWSVSKASLGRR